VEHSLARLDKEEPCYRSLDATLRSDYSYPR
jgi:hypothetical protein